jgi:hypothetical protein
MNTDCVRCAIRMMTVASVKNAVLVVRRKTRMSSMKDVAEVVKTNKWLGEYGETI